MAGIARPNSCGSGSQGSVERTPEFIGIDRGISCDRSKQRKKQRQMKDRKARQSAQNFIEPMVCFPAEKLRRPSPF